VADPWNVGDGEHVAEGFLLEVAQARVGDVIEGPVTKDLEQGLVVDGDDKVGAAKSEVPGFVKGVNDRKGLSFDWGIA
jgi:hypothetical protein